MIAEYAVSSGGALGLARSHTWGLDWSGSRQEAGGVGGLLQTTVHGGAGARYLPAYDGNGNVAAMIDQANGANAAAFEYSAFGELLRATGPAQEACPFRFSTKYTDGETGLVYYGHRYYNYSPSMGRFINRDPIAEQGGVNLYAFVSNDGVNHWDYLGMQLVCERVEEFECELGGYCGNYFYTECWDDGTTDDPIDDPFDDPIDGPTTGETPQKTNPPPETTNPDPNDPNNADREKRRKECADLDSKIRNNSQTLADIAARGGTDPNLATKIATALVSYISNGYAAANTFEGSVSLLYKLTQSSVDIAQSQWWTNSIGSAAAGSLRSAARGTNGLVRDYIAGPTAGFRGVVGGAATVVDAVSIGYSLDHGDYQSAIQTGAGLAGSLIGRAVPVVGAATFVGQQLIEWQANSAQEGIDQFGATAAAYSQTMNRINVSRGLSKINKWTQEFQQKGCGEFYGQN